ncbi:myeloid differentiation primary response protein MyD88-like [Lucilia sericata]|uniref:myeloid differentiation primary response protein MyD88-like n=1 Tax=Lucilia sericata TaxID=13632 RepID=UPI0018A82FDA|nr:myeloid differentiation primary response protein MyD88-like [Lucilia sericata]
MVQNRNISSTARDTVENLQFISKEFEDKVFKEAPLTALSTDTLKKLSNLLNNLMILHSDNGYERDWRGLATLTEQRNLYDVNNMVSNDPLKKVIELWCENKPDAATFGNLITFLGLIDRWHVIEDLQENFLHDFRNYKESKEQQTTSSTCKQTPNKVVQLPSKINENSAVTKEDNLVQIPFSTNENSSINSASRSEKPVSESESFTYESESKVLTSSDVQRYKQGLPLLKYDAFVLYADMNYDYALEILLKLQNNPVYNFKFCLKDDLLFGIPFEHIALMELIRERCNFLIAILTKEFTRSPENRFFVNYAQALQIKHEIRKVIPLMYEENVEVPANLAMFSRMRYNPNRTDLYWSKLADSMQLMQLNEGVATFSATFQRSIVSGRPQQTRNLGIETQNLHNNLTVAPTACSSSSVKKEVRKRKSTSKPNRVKLKEASLKNINEIDNYSNVSSSCSSKESRGILRKLFCCR